MVEYEDTIQYMVSGYNNNSAKFRYLWIISDYLKVKEKLKRPQYIMQKVELNVIPEKFSCKLQLYPHGDSIADGKHASLFLVNVGSVKEAWARYEMTIIGGNIREKYTLNVDDISLIGVNGWGFSNAFPIDFSEKYRDLLLPNGCLQILVEGTAWAEEPVEKGKQTENIADCITSEIPLFESEEHSDSVLSVGDEKFLVHKSILSSKSSVFKKLFEESTQNIIVIPDIDPFVFQVILYFIYNNMLTASAETMLPKILELAHKYELCHLKEILEIKLASRISEENCIEYLVVADKCEAIELKERVLKFISEKKKMKYSQADLMNLPHELLVEVVSRLVTLE